MSNCCWSVVAFLIGVEDPEANEIPIDFFWPFDGVGVGVAPREAAGVDVDFCAFFRAFSRSFATVEGY